MAVKAVTERHTESSRKRGTVQDHMTEPLEVLLPLRAETSYYYHDHVHRLQVSHSLRYW